MAVKELAPVAGQGEDSRFSRRRTRNRLCPLTVRPLPHHQWSGGGGVRDESTTPCGAAALAERPNGTGVHSLFNVLMTTPASR